MTPLLNIIFTSVSNDDPPNYSSSTFSFQEQLTSHFLSPRRNRQSCSSHFSRKCYVTEMRKNLLKSLLSSTKKDDVTTNCLLRQNPRKLIKNVEQLA